MIIGETFQGDYDGYEEESYDYLFKRRTKEERQQKRTERKEKRAEREQQKQDAPGEKSKHPLLGNFGMFDKNKRKNTKGTSGSSDTSAKKEPDDTSGSSSNEEAKKTAAGATTGATQDKSEGSPSANEAGATKQDTKELDKNGKPKEAGFGPMFGFAMLGITVIVIGAVLYGTNKRSKEILPPMKVAA
jgi:cobalamin biosynthesis Mg chelatase CobN